MTVGDIYAVAPFNNTWLLYDLTGEELAQQIVNGWKSSDMGDQVTGLTFEYRDIGTEEKPDIEVVSITLDDGMAVDIHGKKPVYRVIVSNYNATIENSVFVDKTPVYPEAEAPIDNQAIIELLRDRRDHGEEHIPVDRTPRGSEVTKNMKEAA
jgi:2',3'-cyclic-nucleotide 2'-phosphodiesterase (5'-nucleotidase family)